MRGILRLGLMCGTAVALPAHAQTTAAVPAAELAAGLDDIIVTAQRRAQSLQEVPITINAFNAASIAALGAESIGDLDTFTPGLSINDTSVTQPSYSIRGVRTDDFGIGTEPSVGIFVDGIYAARSGSALIFFNDVERVEVLKGPQGTLFGRNTSAGAISIITNKPSDKLEGNATLEYGNYDKLRANATANLPVTGTLALRVNGVFNRRTGYLRDAITRADREKEHNWSGRAALRWSPDSATDFILAYDHDDTAKDGPASIGISTAALSRDPEGPFANDVIDNRETRILNAVSLTARHDFGWATLTSISAYKAFETHNREDEDGTADPTRYLDTENIERNKSFYQELRLTHDSRRLKLLAGLSYYHERGNQTSAVTLLSDSVDFLLGNVAGFPIFSILAEAGLPVFGIPFREDMNNLARNTSYAAYGDATFALTPAINLTAGIRYTHDDKRFTWTNGRFISPGLEAVKAPGALFNAILGEDAFAPGTLFSAADFYRATIVNDLIFDVGALEGVPFTRREKFNDVSPRFVVDWKPADGVLLYVSAARGYKAGGFNSVQINSFFRPESVWNFETGVKSELFDRRLRLNVSGYYFKYKNRQSISLEDTGGQLPQYITRSGDSRAWGIDVESQLVVSSEFTLSATASFIDSQWVSRIERNLDIGGQPTGEPRFRGVLSGRYAHDLGGRGTVFADASYSYTSRVLLNAADRDSDAAIAAFVDFSKLGRLRSPRSIVNARLGWRDPRDRFSVSLWAENLFDVRTPRTLNTISADIFNTPYIRLDKPRLFGVEFGVRY